MPRRRMIHPDFWTDSRMAKASRNERLLCIGLISHADDEGRLMANPAYLKSTIFPYDDDITSAHVKEMRDHLAEINPNIILYENAGDEYIQFKRWERYQKPRYPKPSKYPPPPDFNQKDESLPQPSNQKDESLPYRSVKSSQVKVSLGKVSLGKVSLGQIRGVKEDFKKYFNSETDLTDFLTKTLTDYMSAGRERARQSAEAPPEKEPVLAAQWGMPVVEKFWDQTVGSKLPGLVWQGTYGALQKYPVEVVARAFVKAGRYQGGQHKSWKYIQTIIDEEMEKRGRSPPHS